VSGAPIRTIDLEMHYRVGPQVVRALAGLDLFVPAGQFLVVRGRSGSGKTTLLHVIGGLQRPSRGRVLIGEEDIHAIRARDADRFRRRHVGLIFQFFNLIPSLTIEMNVALPLLLEGRRLAHLAERVDGLLETLGIAHRRGHAPQELSGGEMQRVAIARALVAEPRVILADEPTGNLDTRTAHEVFRLLRDQVEQRGVTAIVMTHDPDVTGYADRVIELCDGRVAGDSGLIAAREVAP
jgi:putative ABC transport system ATP-binding protein